MSKCVDISDHSFQQELESCLIPILVNFWAPWCGPCRIIAPTLEEIAKEYNNTIKIAKINTDENPIVTMEYNVRCVPTSMVFKNGQLITTIIGAVPKSTLITTLKNNNLLIEN